MSIDDVYDGTITPARLLSRLRYIPADRSALARELDIAAAWGPTEHLLAGQLDALLGANWQRSGKGRRPDPVPRPGTSTKSEIDEVTAARHRRWFEDRKAGRLKKRG